jgi:GTP:adenosylcobinamide-phosphate guanylyltransferase
MGLSIILAAAGQGTRLYSETAEINKPLFYFKSKPIIAHLIDLYRQISDNIIVVVSGDSYGSFLTSWLETYYKEPRWLNIIIQKVPSGTNDVLKQASQFVKGECLVSWCDFIIEDSSFIEKIKTPKSDIIFFTSNIDCRFGKIDNKITQTQSNPGFIGIYYFNSLSIFNSNCEDYLENFIGQNIYTTNINIISLGTIKDLIKNNAFKKQSNRFFNNIEIKENIVIKTALTKNAIDLQHKEVSWYNSAPQSLIEYIPKIEYHSEHNKLILEKINGKPLSECILDSIFWREKLPKLLISLHSHSIVQVDIKSCTDIYMTKPLQRLKEIQPIIDCWFNRSYIINGEDYTNWKFPSLPNDLIPNKFAFIHGDLQFSNTMMDNDGNLKIIDPRGFFGQTLLYGDPAYDIAKLLYATDAYHKINEGQFAINKMKNGETILIHDSYVINDDIIWFFDWACLHYGISKEKLNFILFGIWLSLTAYIVDNPPGIIAAYAKAMIRSRHFLLK